MSTTTATVPTTVDLAQRVSIAHRYADDRQHRTACGRYGFARMVYDHAERRDVECPECFAHESGTIRPAALVGLLFALVPMTLLVTFSARLAGMLAGTVGAV